MKIVIGQVAHETNTFSAVPTTKELFELWEWDHGEEILDRHLGVEDYLGGMIDRTQEKEVEVVPTFSAFTNPSGLITAETYHLLKNELIEGIRRSPDADAVCLALHGAAVADGVDDVEGDLLQSVRQAVGNEKPIVVTLDLHGNLTEKMVEFADVLLGVNFYPHTDSYDRGKEAVDVATQIVEGNLKPSMALQKLPMMIPTTTTNLSPAKDINETCWDWEKKPNVVDCTFFHGFAHTDIPVISTSVLSMTNDDPLLARQAVSDVARAVWEKREAFFPDLLSPEEGLEAALQKEGYPIVINETSDNPGGGTPGDGTYLLKAILDRQPERTCFGCIYDPEVVKIAREAGVGSTIEVELGGKTDSFHGDPLRVTAYVKCITDGRFTQSSPMWRGQRMNLGDSVQLQINGVDVVVCSVSSQVFDEQVFLLHGIDVFRYKIVGLKSSQHFRAAYESIAKEIITVDSPGLSTRQLSFFDYKRINRPIYPLDSIEKWDPEDQ